MKYRTCCCAIGFFAVMCFTLAACHHDSASGTSYRGEWNELENVQLTIQNDSIVWAEIWSSEFVGHFNDRMSGLYTIKNDSLIVIQWKEVKKSNEVYTKVPSKNDTLYIIGDTLRKYVGELKQGGDGNGYWYQEKYDLIQEH